MERVLVICAGNRIILLILQLPRLMLQNLISAIPQDMIYFLLTALFALLIGLEQRRHQNHSHDPISFGSDRTFTLIGILGFVLYILDKDTLLVFCGGGLVLSALLWSFYNRRMQDGKYFGFTSLLNALLTFCLAPLIYTQPNWLVLLIVITVLVVTEIKDNLMALSQKFDNDEFITLAKFLALAGVILPLLPNSEIYPGFSITPYQFWLSVVIVSAISYFSYLLQKFVFPQSGILLTGLLGGLYSSTATILILSRRSKESRDLSKIPAAMMLAIGMMFIRVFIIALIINQQIAFTLLPSIALLGALSFILAVLTLRFSHLIIPANAETLHVDTTSRRNPLEFKTALLFGLLFIFFAFCTHYVLGLFGKQGLNLMAGFVGVTDIDPFILSLLQGKWHISADGVARAILIAITSNNFIKLVYTLVTADRSLRKPATLAMGTLILAGLLWIFIQAS